MNKYQKLFFQANFIVHYACKDYSFSFFKPWSLYQNQNKKLEKYTILFFWRDKTSRLISCLPQINGLKSTVSVENMNKQTNPLISKTEMTICGSIHCLLQKFLECYWFIRRRLSALSHFSDIYSRNCRLCLKREWKFSLSCTSTQ